MVGKGSAFTQKNLANIKRESKSRWYSRRKLKKCKQIQEESTMGKQIQEENKKRGTKRKKKTVPWGPPGGGGEHSTVQTSSSPSRR